MILLNIPWMPGENLYRLQTSAQAPALLYAQSLTEEGQCQDGPSKKRQVLEHNLQIYKLSIYFASEVCLNNLLQFGRVVFQKKI